jgi:hypothetical protein
MRKELQIKLSEVIVSKLKIMAELENHTVESWIESLVLRRVNEKPLFGRRYKPPIGQPAYSSLRSAAAELNKILKLEQRIAITLREKELIEKVEEAEKMIDYEVNYLTERTINTLKDIKAKRK